MHTDPLNEFAAAQALKLPNIELARKKTEERRLRIVELLASIDFSEDTDLVCYGSLAREEVTDGSDFDWTLLVDGSVDAKHHDTARKISELVKKGKLKGPNPTGAFGNLTFSHELVHRIGGERDSNYNMTQRILLLSESKTLRSSGEAHSRVVKAILRRYLEEEVHLVENGLYKVPRFLLNDIVRFWRTIAVDFANKQRDRGGEGWGIRNIKLRMSRKLIFVSDLLMCFEPHLTLRRPPSTFGDQLQALLTVLQSSVSRTPLQNLAKAGLDIPGSEKVVSRLLVQYDQFLGIIDDPNNRAELDALTADRFESSGIFKRAKEISTEFADALDALFFDGQLADVTRKYGVF